MSRAAARSVRGVRVSPGYFATLGIEPVLGRVFADGDDVPGKDRVVVLSHGFWLDRLGGRPEAVGTALRLGDEPYTIIGVMPPVTFPGWPVNPATVTLDPEARQLWVPLADTAAVRENSRSHLYGVVARLRDGVTPAHAADVLSRATDPAAADPHLAHVTPLRDQFVRGTRTPLLLLATASVAVLLLACANLTALYYSAYERRQRELSVRAAVGAGRLRLARQLLAEAAVPTAAGGLGGLLLGAAGIAALPSMLPPTVPLLTTPRLDAGGLLFGLALMVVAGTLLTGWPLLRLMAAPAPRGVARRAHARVYHGLVVGQIALALPLAVCATLLASSLASVRDIDTGFTVGRTLVADVAFGVDDPRAPDAVAARERAVLDAVAAVSGVRTAVAAYDHPLEANWSENPRITGLDTAPEVQRSAQLRIVSPGYVDALGVAVVDGRGFDATDALDRPGVALVNERFARELGGRAVGRRLRTGTPRFRYGDAVPTEFEIIGVVEDERNQGIEQPTDPAFYLSTRQFPQPGVALLVQTDGDPLAVAAAVRAAARRADPGMTIGRTTSLQAILDEQLAARTATTDVLGAFGLAGLLLASAGLYGLLSITVSATTRETGIRLALGASPGRIVAGVVRTSLVATAAGVACGALLALGAARLIEAMLVDVSASSPRPLLAVSAALLVIAALAAAGPARRALRVDPVEALRAE